jgi:predicted RND superfamily exporter protein
VKSLTTRRAWILILLLLAGAAALGWQARKFEIDASAETLLTPNNEKYIQSKLVNQEFSPDEFLFIAYEPKNGALLSSDTFRVLRDITKDLEQVERIASVRSILNVPLLSLADFSDLTDIDPAELTIERGNFPIDVISETLRDHPVYEDLLIDKDQSVTALQVLFRPFKELVAVRNEITALEAKALEGELTEDQQLELEGLRQDEEPLQREASNIRNREVEQVRSIANKYTEDANVYLGGVNVVGYQLVEIIRHDLVVFGAAIAILIALLLYLLFRELRWIVVAFACCLVSIVCTIGFFGLFGLKATVISANFIALQLILTLALVVHLIVQYREYARSKPDWDQARLVRETMKNKFAPSVYASITTSVGFASLIASGLQPVISFGWMMMIAMLVSLFVSLSLFPLLLTVMHKDRKVDEPRVVRRLLRSFANLVITRAKPILVTAAAILLLGIAGSLRLDVENSFINYFSDSTNVHRELVFVDQKLGGSTPLDIVYSPPPTGTDLLFRAETFQRLQKLQEVLEKHEAVGKVMSLNNFAELARKVNDGKPLTEYEVTMAYRLMDEDLRESLLGSFFSEDTHRLRVSLRIQDTTPGLDRSEFLDAIRTDVQDVLGDDTEFQLANLFVLYEDILQRLFRSQVLTLGIVLVAVFAAFLAIFRSLRLALIAIVPNILVTITVFGMMGWLGIALDLMTITIAAVAMGIAVDDTIHYIHRFRQEAHAAERADAIRRTHTSVGFAVMYTTIIIVAGFASLAFSDFVPSVLFGLLTGVALTSALLYDITVMPVLLSRYATREPRPRL